MAPDSSLQNISPQSGDVTMTTSRVINDIIRTQRGFLLLRRHPIPLKPFCWFELHPGRLSSVCLWWTLFFSGAAVTSRCMRGWRCPSVLLSPLWLTGLCTTQEYPGLELARASTKRRRFKRQRDFWPPSDCRVVSTAALTQGFEVKMKTNSP